MWVVDITHKQWVSPLHPIAGPVICIVTTTIIIIWIPGMNHISLPLSYNADVMPLLLLDTCQGINPAFLHLG